MKYMGLRGITRTTLIIIVIAVVIAAVAGYYGYNALTRSPPRFEYSNLVVSPHEVKPGEEVTISFDVKNVGGSRGTGDVVINFEEVLDSIAQEVTLDAGESTTVKVTVTVPGGSGPGGIGVFVHQLSSGIRIVEE